MFNDWILDTVKNGDDLSLKSLLENNEPCSKEALDYTASRGDFRMTKILLQYNAPCTANAINQAARNGFYKIVKLLLIGFQIIRIIHLCICFVIHF